MHQDGLAVVSVLLDKRTDGGKVNTELEKIREVLPLIQVRHPVFVMFNAQTVYRYLL